jgi:PAS domain S-box
VLVKNILLVEDEAIVALAEKRSIEGFGYKVLVASTGEEAVETALRPELRVNLVLMDIDLGAGIDGTQAARRILASRNLPIVFLTSHSERERVEKVRGITRYGYVIKNSGDFVLQSSIEMAFELFEAQERSRIGEARIATLLKTIPDLVWLKDEAGVYLACNAAFERFLGATADEIVGKDDYAFLPKEEADFFRDMDRRAVESGGPRINEEWITFADDGHRAYLETIKTPMLDESGRLIGVLGIGRDITERTLLETRLRESEESVRHKLAALVEPEGDIDALSASDILDIPTLQALMEDFSALSGMVVAILDLEGRILVATGWQDICTKFHRVGKESSTACTESDLYLSANVKPGEYVEYRCENGMWDIVTPLYIASRHVGNIYSGQFFYDDDIVDEDAFIAQGRRYGFDEAAYLAALRRVPRISRENVTRLMRYLVGLTDYLSKLGYSNLGQARAIAERERAEVQLSLSLDEKEVLFKELQHRVKNSLNIVSSFLRLNMAEIEDERSRRLIQEAVDRIRCVSMVYEKLSESKSADRVDLGRYLGDLVELIRSTYAGSNRLLLSSRLGSLACDLKRAVSLGLILNELLTNAIKYAYGPGQEGEIRITLSSGPEGNELRISDDGQGLPPGLDPENPKSLGLRIAGLLAAELGGSLRFLSGPGTTASLRF